MYKVDGSGPHPPARTFLPASMKEVDWSGALQLGTACQIPFLSLSFDQMTSPWVHLLNKGYRKLMVSGTPLVKGHTSLLLPQTATPSQELSLPPLGDPCPLQANTLKI
eukprot:252298-Pelagomonas_calceolata.AAC.2